MWTKFVYILPCFLIAKICGLEYEKINLPEEHLPYYFNNFPNIAEECEKDPRCPFKTNTSDSKCWGFELDCKKESQYSEPLCPGAHQEWVQSKEEQQSTFYSQADFGYIKQQLMEMKILCSPLFLEDSSLECSGHMRFCRGRNIWINFTRLATRTDPIRYKMDVLEDGDVGGHCDLRKNILLDQADHLSPLQSWAPELRHFKETKRRVIAGGNCDVIINKPTFIMKIDATVNMYHHFCDFFNLYASLHVNMSHWEAYSTDVNILIWETYTYSSFFQDTWEAFTKNPLLNLNSFKGKTVCFKNVVFPLLPRMIFGLYYNTPLIHGCERSGLFKAFSGHILHRLKIPFHERTNSKVKVTWLSRDTTYRRILNEDEIIKKIEENSNYDVKKVVYNRYMSFKEQLEITRNSDIFVGIHGAGLTHVLFLPDWAAVFEVYDCEDPNCYADLSRLRGVKHFTWTKKEKLRTVDDGSYKGGAQAKFVNYILDVDETVEILKNAASYVSNHPKFPAARVKANGNQGSGNTGSLDDHEVGGEEERKSKENKSSYNAQSGIPSVELLRQNNYVSHSTRNEDDHHDEL